MSQPAKLFHMAIISVAFAVHCSTGADTDTYGTTSSAASSTGDPMVNRPEKDAGGDAVPDAARPTLP